jgi:hypothetical protein
MYSRKREVAARGNRDVRRLDKPGYLIGFNDSEKCANERVYFNHPNTISPPHFAVRRWLDLRKKIQVV